MLSGKKRMHYENLSRKETGERKRVKEKRKASGKITQFIARVTRINCMRDDFITRTIKTLENLGSVSITRVMYV